MTDKTAKALDELCAAARKLSPDQGVVARRNARAKVLAALRKVRQQLDAEYPALRTKGASHRPKLTPGRKTTRLHKRGYQAGWRGDNTDMAARRVGIRVEHDPGNEGGNTRWYPTWLYDLVRAGFLDADFRRAHKSVSARKKLHAEAMLRLTDE